MLPGMSGKRPKNPSITIIGAGNLANGLAIALRGAGYEIREIISRGQAGSLTRARRLAGKVGAVAVSGNRTQILGEVVWFCIPDDAIADAAELLKNATDWRGRIALHSSGALNSGELVELRQRGAAVASAHPMMTFVRGSRPSLAGVPFTIEGDQKAVRMARTIVADLGGQAFSIHKQHKAAYHAWGMFTSPLLIALLATSEKVAAAAGVGRKAARERMLPILRQTLSNYAALGAPGAVSGPIARGDIDTIKKHLKVLHAIPGAREVYSVLARAGLRDLPAKNRAALEKILKD
jgi:predicted short-subunit dehydrogenase-like oxidoreductase (DUF2520 family)